MPSRVSLVAVARLLTAAVVVVLAPLGNATAVDTDVTAPVTTAPATTAPVPTLVAVRAAHHAGFDRVVFEFEGGLPASRLVDRVEKLYADGSGRRVRIAGRTLLRVRFEPAQAHTEQGNATAAPRRRAFPLPNLLTVVRSGDFEAVTTYGLGLAKRTRYTVSTLRDPDRVVIDIRAAFPTVQRTVFFLDQDRFVSAVEPYFVATTRPVRPLTPATGVMDRLFAGPLPSERADGLVLLRSDARSYRDLSVENGVARLRLVGGCDSGGSTVSIAGEILPTLRSLSTVDRVKLFDPSGRTLHPNGPGDSTPACLEP